MIFAVATVGVLLIGDRSARITLVGDGELVWSSGWMVPGIGVTLAEILVLACACEGVARSAGDRSRLTAAELFAVAGRWFLPLFGLTIISGLLTFAGLVLLILPGIYVAVRLLLAPPALVLGGSGGIGAALRDSWLLVAGRWWLTLGMMLVGWAIPVLLASFVGGLIAAVGGTEQSSVAWLVANGLGSSVGVILAAPFASVFIGVLFVTMKSTPLPK
jgi:hypothetical protein